MIRPRTLPFPAAAKVIDLGVLVDASLSSSAQCDVVVQTALWILFIIKHAFTRLTQQVFIHAYSAYVQPLLEYCVQVWSPSLVQHDKYDLVQHDKPGPT